MLHDAAERKEDFADIDEDIASTVREGTNKYMKYYTFMDISDTYYTALILDPRVKADLLLYELDDEYTGKKILKVLRDNPHEKYPETTDQRTMAEPPEHSHKKQKVAAGCCEGHSLRTSLNPLKSQLRGLFNSGRDVLGIRRYSMKGETMRMLMLLDDLYR